MNNLTPQYEEIFVDDQCVIVPSGQDLDGILIDPSYLGLLVYSSNTQKLIENLIFFIRKYNDSFLFGLSRLDSKIFRSNHAQRFWMVVALLRFNNGWQRVHIEHLKCGKCDWSGAIANPTEPDLYLGLKSRMTVMNHVFTLHRLGCPCCGIMLDRHAIWTEECNL